MDQCTEWEINDMIDNIPYLDRSLWESQRLNAYITAQVNSTKKLTLQKICQFKWEENNSSDFIDHDTTITKQDIKRLQKLAKRWE